MAQPHIAKGQRQRDLHADYEGFVARLTSSRVKTTDDCITPPDVMQTVIDWVSEVLMPLDGLTIRRPFYPGGDYQAEAETYTAEDIVIDNPPFSMLSKIMDYYLERGVKFVLFAPGLTMHSALRRPAVTAICVNAKIRYDNKVIVNTSLATNLWPEMIYYVAGDLNRRIAACRSQRSATPIVKHLYPDNIITPAHATKIAERGICFGVPRDEGRYIARLDCGQKLFGGGIIMGDRAAADRAAADRAAAEQLALSPREHAIIQSLTPPPLS